MITKPLTAGYTPTGRTVRTVKALGRGSDYFGACERCGRTVSETFKATNGSEISRPDGTTFLIRDAGVYGHEACVIPA